MKLTAKTLAASAALHATLVALLAARFLLAPEPDADAVMDVCAIDLSLSDSEDESQPETVAPEPPSLAEPVPPRAETPLPEAPLSPAPGLALATFDSASAHRAEALRTAPESFRA